MRPRFLLFTIAMLLLSVGFGLGVLTTASSVTTNPDSFLNVVSRLKVRNPETDWRTFERVWNTLHTSYIETDLDSQALLDGAARGLVDALEDPYSVYLTRSESEEFQQEIEGSFEGVGMEIGIKEEQLTVIAPLADSPAETAGILAGDIIQTIDGADTTSLTLTEAVQRIRGPKGSSVTLGLLRGEDLLSIDVTRDTIKIESVTSRVETVDGVKLGYIMIANFASDTDRAFQRAARDLLEQSVNGFIIDLRNNPGGLLDQAVAVASAFIPEGVIVREVERGGIRAELEREGTAFLADQPTVVLINGGSASASEIVAGALQDTGRATLIGEQTFGKGTVQDFQILPDGSSLKLTIAEWQTPNGRSINDSGIEPDIEITTPEAEADVDPQLERAKSFLTE